MFTTRVLAIVAVVFAAVVLTQPKPVMAFESVDKANLVPLLAIQAEEALDNFLAGRESAGGDAAADLLRTAPPPEAPQVEGRDAAEARPTTPSHEVDAAAAEQFKDYDPNKLIQKGPPQPVKGTYVFGVKPAVNPRAEPYKWRPTAKPVQNLGARLNPIGPNAGRTDPNAGRTSR